MFKPFLLAFFCCGAIIGYAQNLEDTKSTEISVLTNGDSKITYSTRNGLLHGNYESLYPNGRVKAEGKFESNQRVGVWKFYTEDGTIVSERFYFNNLFFRNRVESDLVDSSKSIPYPVRASDSDPFGFYPVVENHISYSKRMWLDSVYIEGADEVILSAIEAKSIKLYDASDDQFRKLLVEYPDTKGLVLDHYILKVDYLYDTSRALGETRIIGITPMAQNEYGDMEKLCLIYYPEIRDILAKKSFEGHYPEYVQNVDDLFFFGMYSGRMIKESNLHDKSLEEPLPAISTLLLIVETDNELIIKQKSE